MTSFSALGGMNLSNPEQRATARRNSRTVSVATKLSTGQGGLAVTNPQKVDVVNCVTPYYSNFRMLPANFMGNLMASQDPDNTGFFCNEAFGGTTVLQQPTLSVKVQPHSYEVEAWIKTGTPLAVYTGDYDTIGVPTADIYHKAGVDFTCFWYLNPPTVYVYNYAEVEENLHQMAQEVVGEVGLLLTDEPIEAVQKYLSEFRPVDFAKSGFVATRTISLPRGEDAFKTMSHAIEPHLRTLGLPTQLNNGKIIMLGDHVVCTEGKELTVDQAQILKLLEIKMSTFIMTPKAVYSKKDHTFTDLAVEEEDDEDEEDMEC